MPDDAKPCLLKRLAGIFLRLCGCALAVGMMWWVVIRTSADPGKALREADRFWLIVALLMVGMPHVLGAWRWGQLLKVQGIACSWWLLYRLTLVGTFFSYLLPGAVTGDIMKLACICRHHPGQGAEVTMSGVMDRVVGVSGMFLVGTLAGWVYWAGHAERVCANRIMWMAILLVTGGSLMTLAVLAFMVCMKELPVWLRRFMPRFVVGILERLLAAAAAYRPHKLVLMQTLGVSMVIHAVLGIGLYFIGCAIRIAELHFGDFFLATQLGNAVTMLPLTPGGLGLRDGVITSFFQSADSVPPEIIGSIPIINSLLLIVWALLGGICLFTLPSMAKSPHKEA